MLQPLLRAVAPDLGLAPPLVRLHDTLAPLRLRLDAPLDPDAGWPLHVDPADPAILRKAARIFAPLARAGDGHVTLGQQGVVELRLAASALEFAGAAVELPSELVEEQDLEPDAAYLEFAPGRPLAGRGRPLRPARVARRARDQRRGVPGARRRDAAARADRRGVAGAQGPRARPRQGPRGDRPARLVDARDDGARRRPRRTLRGARPGRRGGRSRAASSSSWSGGSAGRSWSRPSSRPPPSRASFARTRRSAWGGSRRPASSAWARSSPTTWASERPSR